ncbi:MAG: RidA family protein [Bacteroidetes bacterium]|nr:RidA family protein [Bacteroidota bacterium]
MKRTVVSTSRAPAAIGPYSQAVIVGEQFVYTAGQIPIDPATGNIAGETIGDQTRQALRNLQAVLEAAGSGLRAVIKTTVFLKDMGDFAAMNEVYQEFFPDEPPARSAVEVARLPMDVRVEIEAVGLLVSQR